MADTRTSRRYALAIFGVAEEIKMLEAVTTDLDNIEIIIRQSKEFSLFLRNPLVTAERKKKIFAELLSGSVSEVTMRFIILLAGKNREMLLPEIIREYRKLHDEKMKILNVKAKTAVKFSLSQEKLLQARLETMTGKRVRINYLVDPTLKGGFTVQYGDTVLDASIEHQLNLLKKKFIEGVF